MVLIGYEDKSSNCRLMEPNKPKKVIVSANVKFHEETRCEIESEKGWKLPIAEEEDKEKLTDIAAEQDVVVEEVNTAPSSIRYELRNRKNLHPPDRYEVNLIEFENSLTYTEAIASNNAEEWKKAIDAELQAHKRNEIWIISDLPKDKKVIMSKWVFKIKRNETGNIGRFKARLVARDNSQREGEDYTETFAPVVRYESVLC